MTDDVTLQIAALVKRIQAIIPYWPTHADDCEDAIAALTFLVSERERLKAALTEILPQGAQ